MRAQVGAAVRLIGMDRIDSLRADSRHTLAAWRRDDGSRAEALNCTLLKDRLGQLDPAQFVQR